MGIFKYTFKMLISIAFDAMDFFIGRIPIIGTGVDIAGGMLGTLMWGGPGMLQFIEVLDISDQMDAFFPALTIAGLLKIKSIFED